MAEAGNSFGFSFKACREVFVREAGFDKFDGDIPIQIHLVGAVDIRHAALAQLLS
jgi:hypothetical protein